jgi:hypothetical protein
MGREPADVPLLTFIGFFPDGDEGDTLDAEAMMSAIAEGVVTTVVVAGAALDIIVEGPGMAAAAAAMVVDLVAATVDAAGGGAMGIAFIGPGPSGDDGDLGVSCSEERDMELC